MNAALLKIPGIREGTPYCRVLPIACVADPNLLSAPSQFPFPGRQQPFKHLSLPSGPAFAHFSPPKGRCSVPTKTHAANTRAIDGLVQLGVYLLAPRAGSSFLVSSVQHGALRSNTPFRVSDSFPPTQETPQ
jgi:hypothetical protein